MKTIPTALAAHLQGEVTRLASLFTITRKDGVTFRFTDHDRDLVQAGQIYQSRAGYERTAVVGTSGLEIDSLEVTAVLDDEGITEHNLWPALPAMPRSPWLRWDDLAHGLIKVRRGRVGETATRDGSFVAELRCLFDALKQEFGQIYGPTCRADLGDSRCASICPSRPDRRNHHGAGPRQLHPGSSPHHHQADPRRQGRLDQRRQCRGADRDPQPRRRFVARAVRAATVRLRDRRRVRGLPGPATSGSRPARRSGTNGVNFRSEPHLPSRDFLLTGAEGGG